MKDLATTLVVALTAAGCALVLTVVPPAAGTTDRKVADAPPATIDLALNGVGASETAGPDHSRPAQRSR